jgi:outer membrane cobalamin receptor
MIESRERGGVEAIGTVRVVTARDIEAMGARTLDEALALVPGVIIRTGAAGVPRIDIRGFRSRHVQLLFNGIPMHSTYDGAFDPSYVPVENIERIKVTLSQSSVLYGDGPLGGVINVITKEGGPGVHGRLLAEGDPGDEWLGAFELSATRGRWSAFASGSGYNLRGFELSDDFESTSLENGGTRDNSDRQRRNLFGSLSHALTDELLIGAAVQGTAGEYGRSPTSAERKTDPFASRARFERVERVDGIAGHVSALWDPQGPLSVRSWLYLNRREADERGYDDATYSTLADDRVNGSFSIDDRMLTRGGSVHGSWEFGTRGILTAGLLGRHEDYEAEGTVRDVRLSNGGGGGRYGLRPIDEDRSTRTFTGALEYENWLRDDVLFVTGYGVSWFDPDGASTDRAGNALLGAAWDVREGTRLRASVSRKHRFPSIRQLFEYEAGNPRLHTETTRTWELGIEQTLPGRSRIELTGFFSDIDDYIEKLKEGDVFENSEEYRLRGFELEAETRFRPDLQLRAGYSFLDTEDRSHGAERDELQNRPRHRLTFEGRYRFALGLGLQASVTRVVDSYTYSRTEPLQQGSLDDYTLVSARLAQDLLGGRGVLYLVGENLLDEDYEDSYGFPQRGRTLRIGAELRY